MRPSRDLISIDDLDTEELFEVVRLTDSFAEVSSRPIPRVPALRGKTVVTLFFEDSTRTKMSFEAAAKRLSADTMSFSATSSSLSKGESVRDTVETIDAMGVDAMVVRHSCAGVPKQISSWVSASVVNAGDGCREHPTQALLDIYTVVKRLGIDVGLAPLASASTLADAPMRGLRVGIVGDVKHSRVARSNVKAFKAMGADVVLVGPPTLMPPSLQGWGAESESDLDSVIGDLDVVYVLRIQGERTAENLFPSLREYSQRWGLTADRSDRLRPGALIMHPGPMNRGIEIAAEVASSPRSCVTDQVRNGVAVRMAVLYLLLGARAGAPDGQSMITGT